MSGEGNGIREVVVAHPRLKQAMCWSSIGFGTGLDNEGIERVFVPFYTTKATGSRMPLSICRSIIAAHGGHLWASFTPDRARRSSRQGARCNRHIRLRAIGRLPSFTFLESIASVCRFFFELIAIFFKSIVQGPGHVCHAAEDMKVIFAVYLHIF